MWITSNWRKVGQITPCACNQALSGTYDSNYRPSILPSGRHGANGSDIHI